jgi:hypothetical protein
VHARLHIRRTENGTSSHPPCSLQLSKTLDQAVPTQHKGRFARASRGTTHVWRDAGQGRTVRRLRFAGPARLDTSPKLQAYFSEFVAVQFGRVGIKYACDQYLFWTYPMDRR